MATTRTAHQTYVINQETGELEKTRLYVPLVKHKIEAPHMTVVLTAFDKLSQNRNITGAHLRVLFVLLAHLDWHNRIWISHKFIGEKTGMKPPEVSKAVKLLIDEGIISRVEKNGVKNIYELNLEFGWIGTAKEYNKRISAKAAANIKHLKDERARKGLRLASEHGRNTPTT